MKLFHEDDIIEVGGILIADVFAFEVPRLVCGALDSHLNGVVAVFAVNALRRKKQLVEELQPKREKDLSRSLKR